MLPAKKKNEWTSGAQFDYFDFNKSKLSVTNANLFGFYSIKALIAFPKWKL